MKIEFDKYIIYNTYDNTIVCTFEKHFDIARMYALLNALNETRKENEFFMITQINYIKGE